MGIPKFSEVFPPVKEVKFSNIRGAAVAIDANPKIYASLLAMKDNLTDENGRTTSHIVSILNQILKMETEGQLRQYWIFDNRYERGCVNFKKNELERRAKNRETASKALLAEQKKLNEYLISVECNDGESPDSAVIHDHKEKIEKYNKRAFRLQSYHLTDIQYILDCLAIPWTIAPYRIVDGQKGDPYESEQIAAMLTYSDDLPRVDYVISPDADALLFGARKVIRQMRDKKYMLFDLDQILESKELSFEQFVDVGLMMGTDFAKKTAGIGPKTILKVRKGRRVFETVELTDEQLIAKREVFTKKITAEETTTMQWHNLGAARTNEKIDELIEWLVTKGFNRGRITGRLEKMRTTRPAAKPSTAKQRPTARGTNKLVPAEELFKKRRAK